ncbi:hypothetical protein PIB30_018753 [Stylosanthes scabra]|uniref:Uncharacterized protein n=1 Tax=Stylosanthes scabra TaxID=79078 RepID=A0ABU6Z7G4_9FABA|nr:hypothetical protein [Stylosanthes scabra]
MPSSGGRPWTSMGWGVRPRTLATPESVPASRLLATVYGCIEIEINLLLIRLQVLTSFIARMVSVGNSFFILVHHCWFSLEVPTDSANVQNVPSRGFGTSGVTGGAKEEGWELIWGVNPYEIDADIILSRGDSITNAMGPFLDPKRIWAVRQLWAGVREGATDSGLWSHSYKYQVVVLGEDERRAKMTEAEAVDGEPDMRNKAKRVGWEWVD